MSRFVPASLVVSMVLAIVSTMAGCSGLRSDDPPVQVYVLRAAPSLTQAAREQGEALDSARAAATTPSTSAATAPPPTLQVPRPQADPGLASDQIVLVQSDHRMDRFAGSSWPGALPEVVSTLAIDTLRASGSWAAVHDAPSPFSADYLLQINIRRFEADYTDGDGTPKVYVTLDCTLARRAGRELLTSFAAEGMAEAEENRMSAVIAAFEKAAQTALATMAERSSAAVRTSTARSTP